MRIVSSLTSVLRVAYLFRGFWTMLLLQLQRASHPSHPELKLVMWLPSSLTLSVHNMGSAVQNSCCDLR